jgi:epoxyqueuosine reductase
MRVSKEELLQIKAEVQNIGFSQMGVVPFLKPMHFAFYQHWIDQHYFGDMYYLARTDAIQKKADPRRLFPECNSIICLAYPYRATGTDNKSSSFKGRISSYACNPDYHVFLKKLMEELACKISRIINCAFSFRTFVDSSPILEKDQAYGAGLGWFGKNSCLISPENGSFFFLSEIFSDLEFNVIPSLVPDHCGNCSKCIDACPTHCILPDRSLIAERCISYLTIEHKGIIPANLRSLMGNRVFGCDICQSACPWNGKILRNMSFTGNSSNSTLNPFLDLQKELLLTNDEFITKYNGYPILRLNRNRYLRNIAIALGNQRSPSNFNFIQIGRAHV